MAPPVSGYVAWWDAQAITGLADGAAVTTWPDASGGGHDLNTHLGTPTYYSSTTANLIHGHPAVKFNGDGWLATTGALAQAQPYTIFVEAQLASTTPPKGLIGTASDQVWFILAGGPNWRISAGGFLSGGSPDLNPHAFTGQYNSTARSSAPTAPRSPPATPARPTCRSPSWSATRRTGPPSPRPCWG